MKKQTGTSESRLFPDRPYADPADFAVAYFDEYRAAVAAIDLACIRAAIEALTRAYEDGKNVYVCGNGGSAAIAEHFSCDHSKGARTGTDLFPRVVSLASNTSLMTAISNDISYDAVFAYQLENLATEGDVLVTVSSSGNSKNIVTAMEYARSAGVTTIGFTGFSGGRSQELADINLHVPSNNYGVVEDAHQSLMHILAQGIRMTKLRDKSSLGDITF